jgi:hypothetical protein
MGWQDDPVIEDAAAPWANDPIVEDGPGFLQRFGLGLTNAAGSMVDQIVGGMQRTSPMATDGVQPLGELVQGELGPAYLDANGGGNVDPKQHIVMRDPATGKTMVYPRTETENPVSAIGRIASGGLISTAPTRLPGGTGNAAKLLADYEASGVTPNLPAIAQNGWLSTLANAGKNILGVGGPIVKGTERAIADTARAAEKAAAGYGEARLPVEAGRSAQKGAEAFKNAPPKPITPDQAKRMPTRVTSFDEKSGILYRDLDRFVPGGEPVDLGATKDALGGVMGRFTSNQEFGKTLVEPKFQNWLDKLGEGNLTWSETQEFRSYVGKRLAGIGGRDDIPKADWKNLYKALSRDMGVAAEKAGAAKEFKRATSYYEAGLKRIEDQLDSIMGADSGEQAYGRIISAAKRRGGDIAKIRALKKSLPDEAWDDVAAATISEAGVPLKGELDPLAKTRFSFDRFTSTFGDMSDEAKDLLLGAIGTERRDALETLLRVAAAQKNVNKLANRSHSATAGLASGQGAALYAAPFKTLSLMAAGYLGSKAIMNPGVTRWLARSPMITNGAALASSVASLRSIGQGDPDIEGFADSLDDLLASPPS